MSIRARLEIDAGSARRAVDLANWLDAESVERAAIASNRWIKALRLLPVDGVTLRDRFTYRGDSLWWFAELYLHKVGAVTRWFEIIAALEALLAGEQPSALHATDPDPALAVIGPQVARRFGATWHGPAARGDARGRIDRRAKAWFYHWSARAARRLAASPRVPDSSTVAAFVHSAFWREEGTGGHAGEEGYIGPILRAIGQLGGPASLTLVGVGPRTNFRARRWWHAFRETARAAHGEPPWLPVESLAPAGAIAPSQALWRARSDAHHLLAGAAAIRAHAAVGGYDLWPLVDAELEGVAALQFPWSARAMDEAGAALDRLRPRVVVTYAEAGGWGRAIVLEARRRGIPSVGLQHGFIYRHWLNYLHEEDEMHPSPGNADDAGFPRPDLTLLFDGYAETHLRQAGHFPAESLAVTGSPRLDALVAGANALGPEGRTRARAAVGADGDRHLALVAAKYTQIGSIFPAIVAAVASDPRVQLVVKCHPAETPVPYERDAAGAPNVRVAPASADLAALMASARAIITVNSTVAIDALVLGVPTLVVNLPSNLSPFVDAGVMAGARTPAAIAPALGALLDDEATRAAIDRCRQPFLDGFRIGSDGQAAARAAERILALEGRTAAFHPRTMQNPE